MSGLSPEMILVLTRSFTPRRRYCRVNSYLTSRTTTLWALARRGLIVRAKVVADKDGQVYSRGIQITDAGVKVMREIDPSIWGKPE